MTLSIDIVLFRWVFILKMIILRDEGEKFKRKGVYHCGLDSYELRDTTDIPWRICFVKKEKTLLYIITIPHRIFVYFRVVITG